jgi:hypothetical protein
VHGSGVPIYAVGMYEPEVARGRAQEELLGPARLEALAAQSGGRQFAVATIAEISEVVGKIDSELRAPLKP